MGELLLVGGMPVRMMLGLALSCLLGGCAGDMASPGRATASNAPPTLTGDALAGDAIFKSYANSEKRAVICAGFYRNAARFVNNPVEDLPGNLAFWDGRVALKEPEAAKQAQLVAYSDTMTRWSFGPKPDDRFLDSLQRGANYEAQLHHCERDRETLSNPG